MKKYSQKDLPGEVYYKVFHFFSLSNKTHEAYQDWRRFELQKFDLASVTDIDVLMTDQMNFNCLFHMEYKQYSDELYCLLEMKHANTPDRVIDHVLNSKQPARKLANNSEVPFFIVKYYPAEEFGLWNFKVYPSNDYANKFFDKLKLNQKCQIMSEKTYVKFLFYLHKQKRPDCVNELSSEILPELL